MNTKTLLRNDIVLNVTTYIGYLITLFAVISYFIVSLIFAAVIINGSFPAWLAGAENTNRFRNVLEILYFVANVGVFAVAFYAVTFARRQSLEARRQAAEAERTRKIQVYMRIIDMWNSEEIVTSRRILLNLARNRSYTGYSDLCTSHDYIAFFIRQWDRSRNEILLNRSEQAKKALDLLEYVGALCREGELDLVHLFDFLGAKIEQIIGDFMLCYIHLIRKQNRSGSNYANALFLLQQWQRETQVDRKRFSIDGYGFDASD
jgi:hypothetical protein